MKLAKKVKLLALLTSPIMLAGCFSSDGSSDGGVQVKESQLAIDTSTAPKGPAAYAIHQNLENDQQLLNQLNSIIKRNNESKKTPASASNMHASSSVAFYIDTSEAPEGPAPYEIHKNLEGKAQNLQLAGAMQNNKPYSVTANNSDFSDLSDITVPSSCSVQPPNEAVTTFDDTAEIIGQVADFVPDVAPVAHVFGAVSTILDLFDPPPTVNIATCLKNTLAEVNDRFTKVIADINQLHSEMLNEDNFILSEIAANSFTELAIAYNNYQQNRIQIIGDNNSPGIYQEFLTVTGVAETPMTKLQQVAEEPANMMLATFTLAINGYNIDLSFFNLAGATYDRDTCASTSTSCVNTITAQSNFSDHTNSSLLLLLDLAKAHLLVKIAETVQENAGLGITEQKNILDLYDQYNDFVSSLYLQSLTAMTADYYLMRTANSMNFYAAYKNQFNSFSSSVYIPDFTEIPGTSYQPVPAESNTTASVVTAANNGVTDLKNAQQSLDTFYAGVVNQLYQNIASYIVTDFPVNGQLNINEQADWSSTTFKIQSMDGYSNPAAGTNGYSCWTSTGYAQSNGDNLWQDWTKVALSYDDCKANAKLNNQSKTYTDGNTFEGWFTTVIDGNTFCYVDGSRNVSAGAVSDSCYKWSKSEQDLPYSTKSRKDIYGTEYTVANWDTIPSGAVPTYKIYATIENAIPLSTFVASNAFHPINNPAPDSDPISGMPYLDLSSLNNSVLYQAPHLRDVNACVGSYIASAASGGILNDYYANFETNCPAFFGENGNKGMLSSTPAFSELNNQNAIITPVLINSDGTATNYGVMYGVMDACQSSTELFTYTPTTDKTTAIKGTSYLTCRLWKASEDFYKVEDIENAWGSLGSPQLNNSANDWVQLSAFVPTRNTLNQDIPQTSADWYVTHFSYDKNAVDGGEFWNSIKISSPGNVNPISYGTYFYGGYLNKSAKINVNNITLQMANIVYKIDGFFYPLTIQMFNDINTAGKGFSVVQNAILNNVGFIRDGKKIPITTSNQETIKVDYAGIWKPTTVNWEIQGTNYSVVDPGTFSSKAFQNMVYKDVKPYIGLTGGVAEQGSPNGFNNPTAQAPFPIINGVAFIVNGSQTPNQKTWQDNTMWIGYGSSGNPADYGATDL